MIYILRVDQRGEGGEGEEIAYHLYFIDYGQTWIWGRNTISKQVEGLEHVFVKKIAATTPGGSGVHFAAIDSMYSYPRGFKFLMFFYPIFVVKKNTASFFPSFPPPADSGAVGEHVESLFNFIYYVVCILVYFII